MLSGERLKCILVCAKGESMLQNLLSPGIKITENLTITYYALCIVCGMLVAFALISLLFKRRNMSPDLFLTLFCICLPICLVTTRLFYCITDGMPIEEWFSWESIQRGGLSIVGGITGGLISVFAFLSFGWNWTVMPKAM